MRQEHGLDAIGSLVESTPWRSWPHVNELAPLTGITIIQPNEDGCVIMLGQMKHFKAHALSEVPDDDERSFLLHHTPC